MSKLADAFKQYLADAMPGGSLNPEWTPERSDMAKALLQFAPGVGDVMSGADAMASANAGRYGEAALNAVGLLPFIPALGGVMKGARSAGAISDAERAQRMADMGMERGWYRAGAKIGPDGRRSGPMYTQDPNEVAGYLAGYQKRTGSEGDLREYAIPHGPYLNAEKSYGSRLAHDLARLLDDPYYGKEGQVLARDFRSFGPDERIGGGSVWQALESRYGNDGAAEVIERLGVFKGAKGFTAPGEAYVFKSAPVRDAKRAAFDPQRAGVDDIYGRATVPAMFGSGAAGLLGLEAVRRSQADAERRPYVRPAP